MENIEALLGRTPFPEELSEPGEALARLRDLSGRYVGDAAALETMFNSIDLTTLSATDSAESVRRFVERVNSFGRDYPGLRNVGGVCVYAVFAPIVRSALKVDGVHRAVVAGCFPSSQTFTDVKCAEVRKAVSAGATEVDVVISVGEFLEGNYQFVYEELLALREACGGARLKVILETGALKEARLIWEASLTAMHAGADFIKTSTGKNCDGATPEAALVMCRAIRAFVSAGGKAVGFKPAGGVSTTEEAALYYTIVRETLGEEWLVNTRFRIGASRLANNLLGAILATRGERLEGKYF